MKPLIPLLALLLLAPTSYGEAEAPPQPSEAVVAGNDAFACDLYKRLRTRPGNLFLSPFSVSTALAMTRQGARGETARQMDATLHLPANAAPGFEALLAGLERKGRGGDVLELSVANGLFGQVDYAYESAFLDAVRKHFRAGFEQLDYRQTEAARTRINDWVEGKTRNRIQDIVPPGALGPDTRLVLANAIYFKAQWTDLFSERATVDEPFYRAPDDQVPVQTMRRKADYRYAEDDAVQVLELPYLGGASMIVILPRARTGLADVEAGLTAKGLAGWVDALRARQVDVHLPRFEFTCDYDLTPVLAAMGMPDAFDGARADFSGMTREDRLAISVVLHKAFVAVDENGTEAAAATVVGMLKGAAPMPQEPVEFRADHPFLFLIRHRATGSILFMGRVADPAK